jgi:hypothetical protein
VATTRAGSGRAEHARRCRGTGRSTIALRATSASSWGYRRRRGRGSGGSRVVGFPWGAAAGTKRRGRRVGLRGGLAPGLQTGEHCAPRSASTRERLRLLFALASRSQRGAALGDAAIDLGLPSIVRPDPRARRWLTALRPNARQAGPQSPARARPLAASPQGLTADPAHNFPWSASAHGDVLPTFTGSTVIGEGPHRRIGKLR